MIPSSSVRALPVSVSVAKLTECALAPPRKDWLALGSAPVLLTFIPLLMTPTLGATRSADEDDRAKPTLSSGERDPGRGEGTGDMTTCG